MRISSTDWVEGGWDIEQSVELARLLKSLDVDLIDCSSGGNVASARRFLWRPALRTPFRQSVSAARPALMTGAVGLITSAMQKPEHIIHSGQADLVFLAREMLRDPYFPLRAARKLGVAVPYPAQYVRSGPHGSPIRKKEV